MVDHLATDASSFEEHDDYIVYNGFKLAKPFVEKPVFACTVYVLKLILKNVFYEKEKKQYNKLLKKWMNNTWKNI